MRPLNDEVESDERFVGMDSDAPDRQPELPAELEPVSEPAESEGLAQDTVIAGRYRIETLIGEGGMGAVYKAEHIQLQKPVALKVLHREMTAHSEVVQRFEREAIAAGRIDHPGVAKALDFGRLEDGAFYLVLEFIDGLSLADVLELGALEEERAALIAVQIASALDAAHEAGIVHRDLKPENVMLLERADGAELVKVLDFGIAKIAIDHHGPALTQLGTVFGTPTYMAPEQAGGRAVDFRADLYTVGVLLFEMLTGRPPFEDDEVSTVLTMHLNDPPPPLPEGTDEHLAELTLRLLEKSADARPQSAAEVVQRLEDALPDLARAVVAEPATTIRGDAKTQLLDITLHEIEPQGTAEPAKKPRPTGRRWARRVAVPMWGLVLGASGVFLLGALISLGVVLLVVGDDKQRQAAPAPVTSAVPELASAAPAALQATLARAASGDTAALETLEARPVKKRSAQEWLAIARGRSARAETPEALEAYSAALRLDASLAGDQSLLRDVRQAARKKATSAAALRIAGTQLGAPGADILYAVWVATRAKTATTELARSLLFSPDVRRRATPALDVLLDLRLARECSEYKQLLPRVTLHGDMRAARLLERLEQKRGCGHLKLSDCYRCLRGSGDLATALKAVRSRPSPRF